MITIAKLESLKDRTCVRKCALLFHQQAELAQLGRPERQYLLDLTRLFASKQFEAVVSQADLQRLRTLAARLRSAEGAELAFVCDDIHHLLLEALGNPVSDWDFYDGQGQLDASQRTVREYYLVLDRIRSPYNVGSIFRSADSFGIKKIFLVEGSARVDHPRTLRTSRGCTNTVEWEQLSQEQLLVHLDAMKLPVFAVETGGVDILRFPLPEQGVAVLGSEEFGVSPALLSLCDTSLGRLSIGQAGTKGSLNVAVAAGIVMHRWFCV